MEPWRAVDTHNGGVEAHNGGVDAQYGALEGCVDQWLLIPITLMRSRIRIRIKMKSLIQIRIKVMRIRNPGTDKHEFWIPPHIC
jgi:hypothetical protein